MTAMTKLPMAVGMRERKKFKADGLVLSGETMMYVLFIIVIMAVVVLNWNKFVDLPIPLPPLNEQKRIVKRVEALKGTARTLVTF